MNHFRPNHFGRAVTLRGIETEATGKRIASLSLDLDNKWTYMKIHGDAGWERYPSYLDIVVPRILGLLDEMKLTATIFVVGRDATRDENAGALKAIARAGHEIANHSFNHEPWLHLYSRSQLDEEIEAAETAIEAVTGHLPRGFRGPGFSVSPTVLEALQRRGYTYDASTFPTFLGPVARTYYLLTTKLPPEERMKRKQLFGRFSDGLRPLNPYKWDLAGGSLLEIPVSTFPLVRTPFHLSYILYLASFSNLLARTYFASAVQACRLSGVQPSLLLHPLDFLGGDDIPELKYFPAMNLTGAQKCKVTRATVKTYSEAFQVVSMAQHATLANASAPSRVVS